MFLDMRIDNLKGLPTQLPREIKIVKLMTLKIK